MSGNTFKMLALMKGNQPTDFSNHSAEEPKKEQSSPQLRPSMRMDDKLQEILGYSLTKQHSPMDN